MNLPGPLTVEVARKWFLATVFEETSALDELQRTVDPVYVRTLEKLSGQRPPYRLDFGNWPRPKWLEVWLTMREGPSGLPDTLPADPALAELAEALLAWAARWRYLRSGWALKVAFAQLGRQVTEVIHFVTGKPVSRRGAEDVRREILHSIPTRGEAEVIRFFAEGWRPSPTGPRRMPRAKLREDFEDCLDLYEARQFDAYRRAGGKWPEAKRDDKHFRWLLWRLEGDSEGDIARREHVKKAVISRETVYLAQLLNLGYLLERSEKGNPNLLER